MPASYAIDGSECKRDGNDDVSPMARDDCNDPWMPEKALRVLAANLKAILEDRDPRTGKKRHSALDLAEKTKLPIRNLYRWLNAENAPRLDQLDELAKGLRVQPWELITPRMTLPPSEEAATIAQQLDALPDDERARVYAIFRLVLGGHMPPSDGGVLSAEPEPEPPPPAPTTKRAKAR